MAVKARETLYEEDPSDNIESSSYEEEEEAEEEYNINCNEEEWDVELHDLHKRISQTYPLSGEALGVLHTALLSLNKESKLHDDNSLISPLLLELKSLRTLIPPTKGDEGSTSCVITCALNYLEQLNKVIQSLKESMQESTSLSGGSSKGQVSPLEGHSFCNVDYAGLVKLESISNDKLHVLVHCKKREGIMSSLILALNNLDLVIDQMNISCNDVFMMDAITTQVGEKSIDDESVREALWKIIHEGL